MCVCLCVLGSCVRVVCACARCASACVRACVLHACVSERVGACVRACVRACVWVWVWVGGLRVGSPCYFTQHPKQRAEALSGVIGAAHPY